MMESFVRKMALVITILVLAAPAGVFWYVQSKKNKTKLVSVAAATKNSPTETERNTKSANKENRYPSRTGGVSIRCIGAESGSIYSTC